VLVPALPLEIPAKLDPRRHASPRDRQVTLHVRDIGETWSDSQIWQYARERDLVIVSKDTDFSDRAMINAPPPRVVHLRIGSMRMRDFHALISRLWPSIAVLIATNRLVRVYENRIEAVE
jgi:predicted nuclease of predicted toxin-antitoxin system